MRSLGVRAINGGAHWALVEGTRAKPSLLASGTIPRPKAFSDYQALMHLRETLRDLLLERQVDCVTVRESDYVPGASKLFPRVRAEGVALEIATSEAKPANLLQWTEIRARLDIENVKGKRKGYLAATTFRGVNCGGFGPEDHDALHAAVAGLPK